MVYKLGKRSKDVYATLHPYWRLIIDDLLKIVDVSLIEGLRDSVTQVRYYAEGKSKLSFPLSRHNRTNDPALQRWEFELSDAVDLVPYPSAYSDVDKMIDVSQIVLYIAGQKGIKVRWGGDWNNTGKPCNGPDDFFDPWHFELIFD
jgi:peptidoglycan L-alanyl-D-glutamate endopeptidase CwlK